MSVSAHYHFRIGTGGGVIRLRMELPVHQIAATRLRLPFVIYVDVCVHPVTLANQSNGTAARSDAALELQLLQLRWGWITNDYGPNLRHDDECCMNEVTDWYNDAKEFQAMWGRYNTPQDVAVAIAKVEAEIFANTHTHTS